MKWTRYAFDSNQWPTNHKKKKEKINFLWPFLFNKLSNLRSNKDKQSTHENVPETSLLCFFISLGSSLYFSYHNKQRTSIEKCSFFLAHFICNQLNIQSYSIDCLVRVLTLRVACPLNSVRKVWRLLKSVLMRKQLKKINVKN